MPANDATRAAFPAAESIATAPGTPVTLPQLGKEPVQLQRLTDEQYQQYLHALQVAEEPAEPAAGCGSGRLTTKADSPAPTDISEGEAAPGETAPNPAAGDVTDGPAAAAGDEQPSAPEISVPGPLTVSGITHSGHGPNVAALVALIHLHPGRTAEFLCTAMAPVNPWSTRTLQTRLSEIRSRPDGQPCLPRPKHGYSFHPHVASDWRRFQDLAIRGLALLRGRGSPPRERR
ncbi:hypothetical protein ACH4TY_26960 [Streptomyces anulatus]